MSVNACFNDCPSHCEFRFWRWGPGCHLGGDAKTGGRELFGDPGFFRYYELIYTIADERDVVRLRTNYRTGEEVYLRHTGATPDRARAFFLDYVSRTNRMRDHAEWYNALTNNCTTNIASHVATARGTGVRWDWRILLNGKADEMMYEQGELAGDLPFAELKEREHINAVARAADRAPDFSRLIREGRPGFEQSLKIR